ncbi:unnamed protein product [Clavelina lepadiformis]|uniref:LisH domain-containing protein n=1 Tax=Clavelina lepadiformis TaxID=159417 RepID=A0ABP0FCE8_CLALP
MATPDDYRGEINKIFEEWNENRTNEHYDVVPFLTQLSERFEKEAEEFHKQDPDPFDDRHPAYTMPTCAFGKLLKALTRQEDFLDAVVNTYLKSRSRSTTHPDTGLLRPSTAEATARLLLTIMPGLDSQSIFTNSSDILPLLYDWAKNGSETLRTYATGILASAAEHQEVNSQHTSENATLVPILLKRLWNYIQSGRYSSEKSDVLTISNSSSDSLKVTIKSQSQQSTCKPEKSGAGRSQTKENDGIVKSSKKRKLSGDNVKKTKSRKIDDKSKKAQHSKGCEQTASSVPRSRLFSSQRKADLLVMPSSDLIDINDCSNSSWAEILPIVIGGSHSLEPPLNPTICERYILNLLIPLGEYQDLLSHFIEHHAIDLVNHYLEHSHTNNGLLTFSAMRFFASLLCHNKIATAFIEDNGVQRLLSVRRPSIGATGASLCLYYLAYNQDAMERVCQLPNKVLNDLVKYAVWLLECSHDSGRCHAALFFYISFQFPIILKLFDQKNGLRCLLNILSTLPIIRLDEPPRKEDEDTYRQTARTILTALRKYFEAHLVSKAASMKEIVQIDKSNQLLQRNTSKVINCDRENVLEHLDFLLTIDQRNYQTSMSPSVSLINWTPVQSFLKLEGVSLLLRLIALACDWTNYWEWGKAEVVRFALDCLVVVSLSREAQLVLCNPVSLPSSFTEETGISIVLGVAEGEAYLGKEPEAQKSALSVVVNCVCGSEYKTAGAMAKMVNGIPQLKLVSKSHDESRKLLWDAVKTNNGIKILLQLLISTHPAVHADDIRLLACKALCGLSRCESVKQIMSKLPMFNNGQLQALTKQPVMQDRRKQHVKFCIYVEDLTEKVSGKPSTLQMDLDSLRKAHIVSQTMIRYDNRELLQLIHNHLSWSGLHSTASMLAREASLHIPTTSSTSLLSTPRNISRTGAGDSPYISPVSRRISFSRGAHAHGETPALSSHSSLIFTPNQRKGRFKFKADPSNSSDIFVNPRHTCHLSSNGRITVVEPGLLDGLADSRRNTPCSSATLNTIVAEYLKNQHSHCKNPVVTVPEFSLLRPHYCPEPRFRVEAPLNISSRSMRRQVAPKAGGIGGSACDRHFIYSRFRPNLVFRAPEEENVPYTCCNFTPDNLSVILGNYQGDLTIHSIQSEQDRVLEGVANAPIVKVEPARDGKRLLIVEDGMWRRNCSLYSMHTSATEFTFGDCSHVEFPKVTQNSVLGTKGSAAIIYDAESGQKIRKLERVDLASNYTNNQATFSADDELILSDGLLWDARVNGNKPIHKFDKFNSSISGDFHPKGLEVIINTEIWDLRSYHLLHTVPMIDQCTVTFNGDGTILYATKSVSNQDLEDIDEDDLEAGSTTFHAIDAHDYRPLSVTDTKHKIYDFAADRRDSFVAVVERQNGQWDQWDGPSMSVCRLYEVGRVRGEDEEDEQGDENVVDDNNDDDYNDNDNDDRDLNSDEDDDISFSETGSGSSFDIPSFAFPLSSDGESLNGRRSRRSRRQRRTRRRNGSPVVNDDQDDDTINDDAGWSTIDDDSSSDDSFYFPVNRH